MGGDSYFYRKPGSNGGNGNGHNKLLQILHKEIARIPQLSYDETIKIAREMAKEQKVEGKINSIFSKYRGAFWNYALLVFDVIFLACKKDDK